MSNILYEIKQREITRLCHFTKSNNLPHILKNESGILANTFLDDQKEILKRNDINRYDGKEDFVCTSVQYPNYWYFKKIKDRDPLFKQWVILFTNPILMNESSTLFCHRNAAANRGAFIKSGFNGFEGMFKDSVFGQRLINRSNRMLPCCPTDDQAEVLIYNKISRSNINAIAVPNEEQAIKEKTRLSFISGIPKDINWIIAPELFNGNWSAMVRRGEVPREIRLPRE
ncbi:DarT ssDNA thymidine ADP-ribosyltransferase family protein [Rossellomorea marisflavi]|uniref:DarT ssDNA thymidine ADP-ribosyltransferase family protein n=1 Tax=Rossellomorea marisflavi TaxID=189381 RepID=UPI003D2F0273